MSDYRLSDILGQLPAARVPYGNVLWGEGLANAAAISSPRYPRPRAGDLGPNQIAWLRKNIPAFNIAKDAADRVRAEIEANRREMGS